MPDSLRNTLSLSISIAYRSLFLYLRKRPNTGMYELLNIGPDHFTQLYQGDAYEVLSALPENSIDVVVTSPPYYNAREYSVWPNIYCYLYDMYNISNMIYRTLKPGGIFLLNIFDYFDNENNIVFSTMGKKRMILGAYMIQVIRKSGFLLLGNTIWHKGEIEGKRNFNQGNMSPYYQAPHNCWEHILLFSKGKSDNQILLPTILRKNPVIKIINGVNVLGHSAPFPDEIPNLLLNNFAGVVLDPFSGSMTTGRIARKKGICSINIELHTEYCELGLELMQKDIFQLELC
jgi:DNA modification methylase